MQNEETSTVVDLPSEDHGEMPKMKSSKWIIVKAARKRILPQISKGEIQLTHLIDELNKFTGPEQDEDDQQILRANSCSSMRIFRQRLTQFLQKPTFHYIIIALVMIDLIVVLIDLVLGLCLSFSKFKLAKSDFCLALLSSPCFTDEEFEEYHTTEQRQSCLLQHSVALAHAEVFLYVCSVLLLGLFVVEVFVCFYAFGWRYFLNILYSLDAIVVFASFIMELYFHFGDIGRAGRAASAIVILRLWKVVRAIHAVAHSITMKNQILIKKIQEAKILLEEEKEQIEETLEKQEIKLEYFVNLLTNMNKLPSSNQINKHVEETWTQKKQTVET